MRAYASLSGVFFFFFNDTATTEIYTLSLHDALPICSSCANSRVATYFNVAGNWGVGGDRKSTRLNSSHRTISYAVFCLKKKYIYVKFITGLRLEVRGRIQSGWYPFW